MSTAARRERQKRNQKINAERQRLMSLPGAMATAVDEKLSKKYGVCRSTIWTITKQYQSPTQHGINHHRSPTG